MADQYNDLPNINRALGIEIEQSGDSFRADAKKLPGSPVVGIGKCAPAARYDLLVNMIYQLAVKTKSLNGNCYGDFIEHLIKEDWEKFT